MSKVADRSTDSGSITSSNRASDSHQQTVLFEKSLGKIAGTVQSTSLVNALSRRLEPQAQRPVAVYSLRMVLTREEIEAVTASDNNELKTSKAAMSALLKQYHSKADALAIIDVTGAQSSFTTEKIDDLLFVEGAFFDKTCKQRTG